LIAYRSADAIKALHDEHLSLSLSCKRRTSRTSTAAGMAEAEVCVRGSDDVLVPMQRCPGDADRVSSR
jgi:hypothetical protein